MIDKIAAALIYIPVLLLILLMELELRWWGVDTSDWTFWDHALASYFQLLALSILVVGICCGSRSRYGSFQFPRWYCVVASMIPVVFMILFFVCFVSFFWNLE